MDAKTQQFQKWPKTLLLDSIFIVHKWLEDANNKNKDLKAKIYHIALKTILQYTSPSFSSIDFKKKDADDVIALFKYTKDGIELVCTNDYKRRCYSVLAGLMVDYEEHVFIINIKTNMQCLIYYISSKKLELVTQL